MPSSLGTSRRYSSTFVSGCYDVTIVSTTSGSRSFRSAARCTITLTCPPFSRANHQDEVRVARLVDVVGIVLQDCFGDQAALELGEASWRDPADRAVRPDLVVVASPSGDRGACLMKRLEPVVVEVLVPEASVKALDVPVLHRPARLDQDVPDAMARGPAHERSTGELSNVERGRRAGNRRRYAAHAVLSRMS